MSTRNAIYWTLRRELWEYRAIYIGPLAIGALALIGFAWASFNNSVRLFAMTGMPYSMAASIILVTCWFVGIMYAADTLHGDRRDRSILFWKSMPVSDLVTVAVKAGIPLVVIPLIGSLVAIATQLSMLIISSVLLAANDGDASLPWRAWPMFTQTLVMLYGVGIHVLWYAPVYAWLMLISAWVPRAVLLFAVLPFFALFAFEKLSFGTAWLMSAINYRIFGGMNEGFTAGALRKAVTPFSELDPARFFSNPNLWYGLVFAAACFALILWRRRFSEPI
jgi:ABC-2 type transport system permease protein